MTEQEKHFEEWYSKWAPPAGMFDEVELNGVKTFAKHAYLQGVEDGLLEAMKKLSGN